MWRDISTAPRDGTEVDLWVVSRETGKGYRRVECAFDGEFWVTRDYAIVSCAPHFIVTHWMPLPPPPQGNE